MYRAEIIANKSVQEEITESLELNIPHILYTIIPTAYGRGADDRKLGSATWPESNFVLFAYLEKKDVPVLKAAIAALKKRFQNEGIKLFLIKSK